MPTPRKNEKKDKYIQRCMKDLVGKEKRDPKQARAICESYWERRNKKGGEAKLGFNLELFQNRVWCIHPNKLEEINLFVQKSLTGEFVLTKELIDASIGPDGNKASDSYEVVDGVAILPVYGTIGRKMNLMSILSGGTSTDILKRDTIAALEDDNVEGILFDIDSPGGTVDGTKEFADFLYSVRGEKPLVAHTGGQMTSAAYWIGSAADEIMAFDTAEVGSIGVRTVHYDYSKANDNNGIVKTDVYSGKYKAILSDAKPLSGEGKEYLQEIIDRYFEIFVSSVAKNRGLSFDDSLKMASDSKVFVAVDAEKLGMIDRLGSFSDAINRVKDLAEEKTGKLFKGVIASLGGAQMFDSQTSNNVEGGEEEMPLTLKELREKHPDLVSQIENEFGATLQVKFEEEKKTLSQAMADLSAQNDSLKETVLSLEKELTVGKLESRKALIDSTWAQVLAGSDLPNVEVNGIPLHTKLKDYVDPEKFMENGDFNIVSFEEAVRAEVSSWEGVIKSQSATPIIGGGTNRTKVAESPEDEDAAVEAQVQKMLAAIAQ